MIRSNKNIDIRTNRIKNKNLIKSLETREIVWKKKKFDKRIWKSNDSNDEMTQSKSNELFDFHSLQLTYSSLVIFVFFFFWFQNRFQLKFIQPFAWFVSMKTMTRKWEQKQPIFSIWFYSSIQQRFFMNRPR